jgi:hypothetical protein
VTGSGDLWCRVVARSNADLQQVLDGMVGDPGVVRAETVIGLTEPIGFGTAGLIRPGGPPDGPR